MKTLIGINNLTSVEQPAYANHLQFFYRLGKEYHEHDFALCNPRRMSIDNFRNFCALVVCESNFDYLLFIDDDVLIPFDAFRKLKEADKDIIAGITLIRGYPYHPMVFSYDKERYPTEPYMDDYESQKDEAGLVKCDALGCSCTLIKGDLIRKLKEVKVKEEPFFLTVPDVCTEDIWFCNLARKYFPETSIYAHPMVETAHILGPELIEPNCKKIRTDYDESMNPKLKKTVDVFSMVENLPGYNGQMTRLELKTKIRENLNDAGVTFYSEDDLNDSIQDGYDDISVVSGCIQKSGTLTLLDNTTYYDMLAAFSDFFALVAAYNNNTNRWIDFDALKQFDNVRIDWEIWAGSQPLFGAISNFRYVAFVPRLTTAFGNATIWYRALAPTLTSDSDEFLIHLDKQELLEWYVTADMLDQQQEYIKADSYWANYFEHLLKYKSRIDKLAMSDYLPTLQPHSSSN